MRACERYIDLMMRSIDRETTPREEAELRAHMDQCAACRALYEAYRAVDTGISALEEEPPETLTAAVMNSIHTEQQQKSPKHLLRRFRFTAIAAVAAVLVLVFARFQPDAASVTGNNMRAASSASDAVPQAEYQTAGDAAWMPAPEEAAAEETMEDAMEDAAPEECAPETAEMPMAIAEDDAGTVAARKSSDDSGLSEQADALHALGRSGDILLVSGVSDETLQALFPEAAVIDLETGRTVYEVAADAVETAVSAGELTIMERFEDVGDLCYLLLDD